MLTCHSRSTTYKYEPENEHHILFKEIKMWDCLCIFNWAFYRKDSTPIQYMHTVRVRKGWMKSACVLWSLSGWPQPKTELFQTSRKQFVIRCKKPKRQCLKSPYILKPDKENSTFWLTSNIVSCKQSLYLKCPVQSICYTPQQKEVTFWHNYKTVTLPPNQRHIENMLYTQPWMDKTLRPDGNCLLTSSSLF